MHKEFLISIKNVVLNHIITISIFHFILDYNYQKFVLTVDMKKIHYFFH